MPPEFICLTNITGKPIVIATQHITDVTVCYIEPGAEHREMDPDCPCEQCKPDDPHATKYREQWSNSTITTDRIESVCEEHGPEYVEYDVRETVEEIAELLNAVGRSKE